MVRRILFFLSCWVLVVVVGAFVFLFIPPSSAPTPNTPPEELFPGYPKATVRFGSESFPVFVADTSERRAQGLSDISGLPEKMGMAFLFDQTARQPFWMHRMRFSLDIIWTRDSFVVDLWERAPVPEGGIPASYIPQEATDMVFEFSAGFVAAHHITIGDRIEVVRIHPK